MDDKNSYPALLGINSVIDNQTIIDFKKIILTIEYSDLRAITPIDLLEGQIYAMQVNIEGQGDYIDQIYKITSTRDDYANPTDDRKLSWRSVCSCTSDCG